MTLIAEPSTPSAPPAPSAPSALSGLSGGPGAGSTPDVDPEVLAFYTEHCDEHERLTSTLRGRLEAVRIRELLAPHLPAAPGPVADIGGGPGVHATWFGAGAMPWTCWTRSRAM